MIARNRATDFHRRAVESVELPDDLVAHDGTAARTEALAVLEIIGTLPDAYRETLVLRLVEGLTGPGDCRAHGADARIGAREPSPRHEAVAREARTMTKTPTEDARLSLGRLRRARSGSRAARDAAGAAAAPRIGCRRCRRAGACSRRRVMRWIVPALSAAAALLLVAAGGVVRLRDGAQRMVRPEPRGIAGRRRRAAVRRRGDGVPAGRRRASEWASGWSPTARRARGLPSGRLAAWTSSRTRGCSWSRRAGASIACRSTRGTIHARIWAPPRFFFVNTPSAVAIDLGCEYTLQVDDAGAGLMRVTPGWVGFESDGRESFVPEGADVRDAAGRRAGHASLRGCAVRIRRSARRFSTSGGRTTRAARPRSISSCRRPAAATR